MTDKKLRIKVAEVLGWKDMMIEPICDGRFGRINGKFAEIPHYESDLNAMHEAEKTLRLTGVQGCAYLTALEKIVLRREDQMEIFGISEVYKLITATAKQRALAFVKAMEQGDHE
jgi:hypothetical protein